MTGTYVSQCLEIDIASQGATEEEALENLREALELHFEPPQSTRPPEMRLIEVGRLNPLPYREEGGALTRRRRQRPTAGRAL